MLAWYFAAMHTQTDAFQKRNRKGYLIAIGDESTLDNLPKRAIAEIMGPGQHEDYASHRLVEMASEVYNVFHLNIAVTPSGGRESVQSGWKQMLADNFVNVQFSHQVAEVIADLVVKGEAKHQHRVPVASNETGLAEYDIEEDAEEEVIL